MSTEMVQSKISAKIKRKLLHTGFGKQREAWADHNDDRGVFCSIYDLLLESLDVMETIDNNLIWVAYNKKFNDEIKILEKIKNHFQ